MQRVEGSSLCVCVYVRAYPEIFIRNIEKCCVTLLVMIRRDVSNCCMHYYCVCSAIFASNQSRSQGSLGVLHITLHFRPPDKKRQREWRSILDVSASLSLCLSVSRVHFLVLEPNFNLCVVHNTNKNGSQKSTPSSCTCVGDQYVEQYYTAKKGTTTMTTRCTRCCIVVVRRYDNSMLYS